MDVLLLPNGKRNRNYRPYIEQEEQANSVYLYNPNGPGFYYGLYSSAGQPSCGYWEDLYSQFPSHVPAAIVDSTGRTHLVKPSWYKFGYKYQ